MERRELGRIQKIDFGMGGYQDAQFGLSVTLGGDSWAVGDFWGHWSMAPTAGAQWTVEDQSRTFSDVSRRILALLQDAKVDTVAKLAGKPIEAAFDGNKLVSWRILKEVL